MKRKTITCKLYTVQGFVTNFDPINRIFYSPCESQYYILVVVCHTHLCTGKPEKNHTPVLEEEHTSPAWLSPRRANLICNTSKRFLPKATTRDSTCISHRSPKRQGLIKNPGCFRSWISRYFIYIVPITNAKYTPKYSMYNMDNNGKMYIQYTEYYYISCVNAKYNTLQYKN